jgi:IclR family transcriptional regulator, acetate operon repressor
MSVTAASVKSAQRVIDILEFYATCREPATLTSIASALQLPKSSCLALLATLESHGYLYEVRRNAGYYPTRRWLDKAQVISANDPLAEMLRPHLIALRDDVGETVILGKNSADQILYIEVFESLQTLRYTAVAGQFKPLHGTASGKAHLSSLTDVERSTLLKRLNLDRLTPHTIVDPIALERDIKLGVTRGWQLSQGENVSDASAVAVPISLMREVFVLIVAGPSRRLKSQLKTIGARLQEARADIENHNPERRSNA